MSGGPERESLSRRLHSLRSSPREVLTLMRRLAAAMQDIHRRGMACRLLDPESIRLGPGDDMEIDAGPGGSTEADLRAFGALLRRAFPDPPPSLVELRRRCEAADTAALRSMGTIVLMLDQAMAVEAQHRGRRALRWRTRMSLAVVIIVSAVSTLAGVSLLATRTAAADAPLSVRLRLSTGIDETTPFESAAVPLLSPAGSIVVFRQRIADAGLLALQRLDTGERRSLSHIPAGAVPFGISPDGRELVYVWRLPGDQPGLYAAPLDEGPTRFLARSSDRGASWGEDGRIVFTPDVRSGLYAVPAIGGDPVQVTELDRAAGELSHRWPSHLPGDRGLLFTIASVDAKSFSDAIIAVLDGRTGEVKRLLEGGTKPEFLPPDRLVYARDGGLMAVSFDLESLTLTGAPERVLDGVSMMDSIGSAGYSISRDGTLAYLAPSVGGGGREIYRRMPGGESETILRGQRSFATFDVAPDGRRIALTINEFHDDIWLYDLDRTTLTRLTFGDPSGAAPRWSADGRRVAFIGRLGRAGEGGEGDIFWVPADGSEPAAPLVTGPGMQAPKDFTPDGRLMLYTHAEDGSVRLDVLELEGEGRTFTLLPGLPPVLEAQVDPTGRWVAYRRGDLEDNEVGLVSFPDGDEIIPLQRGAFSAGRWSPSGDLYLARPGAGGGQRILVLRDAVSQVEAGAVPELRPLEAGPAEGLLPDVSPVDGSLFFVKFIPARWEPWIHLVLNWRAEPVETGG